MKKLINQVDDIVSEALQGMLVAHPDLIEINPSFPVAGDWGMPEIHYGSRLHEDLVIRVRPSDGDSWVGYFATETRGLHAGVYAGPNPQQLLVATGLDAYLVQVDRPSNAHELEVHPITAVARPEGTYLLVIGSFNELAAVDAVGLLYSDGWSDDVRFVLRTRDRRNKAIATSGDRLNAAPLRSPLIQDPAKRGYLYSQVAVLDHRSRPDGGDELVF